ncbi:unnamed protein product [Spirodela intermedia]|uniref:3-ketoacyl-CoA synthase n=1 Tax=Spirodela intermedia TaxID=51605 RepID=A0A7I8LK16_SPIIN|nr:unnamed protein product [Spirodela intermedia]
MGNLPASTVVVLARTLILKITPSSLITSLAEAWEGNPLLLFSLAWCSLLLLLLLFRRSSRRYRVLLLDYACYKAPSERRCTYEVSEYVVIRSGKVSMGSQQFTREVYAKSGLGDETYAPPLIFREDYASRFPSAIQEAEEGMFSAVESLLSKTQVLPSQVDVLIVACSMFSPSPSLCSMLVHRFGFHPSIKSFSFSGMGCSAGGIAIDAAAQILRRKPGYALIVTTENTSLNWYFGDERSMIVTNCIFRVGSAAVLLTSDPARGGAAKLELLRTLRTHHGTDDAAYGAALQQEDDCGNVGVALSKDLVRVAGAALRRHITTLAPRVLPISELLRYACATAVSFIFNHKQQQHVPDFMRAFEHVCLHPGGKAVVNAVGRLMKLPETAVEPARMTLHRFGNTSSSSVFYELAYFEAKKRLRRGDRLWMLSFGTGFKACSLVWRCLSDSPFDPVNPWNNCAFRYPV